MLSILAGVGACSDAVAPPPVDDDPPPTPYLRSSVGVRVNGATRILIIPAQFADGPVPTATWTQDEIHRRYIGNNANPGYTAITYRVASEGKFALRADIAPWVKTTINGLGVTADHVTQAVAASDAAIDFRQYDNDGPDGVPNSGDDDGLVDGGVVILHSSPDLTCNPTGPAGPHPHARTGWRIGTPPRPALLTQDPSAEGGTIGVQGYTVMSVFDCGGVSTNAAVLAHELGHLLFGITDLYHIAVPNTPSTEAWKGRRWVLGCWELMSAGSGWGCGGGPPSGGGEIAATMSAWTRTAVGWTIPWDVPASVEGIYTLNAVGKGGTVLKLGITTGEYFLVEYRQKTNGDMRIPANGVLISHITESLPFRPAQPTDPRKYRVALVEADDDSALVRIDAEGGNRGVANDAFGRSVFEFGSATHSAAKMNSGAPLPFRIQDISFDETAGTARVRVVPIS